MTTQIAYIQPRRKDWRTQTNADWLDSMLVWKAGAGGVVAGPSNVGNGSLVISAVDPSTPLGAHSFTVTSVGAGIARFTVQNPAGDVTGQWATGLAGYAGGINFALSSGSIPFAVGDTFVVGVLQTPIDITGLRFLLQARAGQTSAGIALSADSAPSGDADPTIATGGTSGAIAMYLFADSMASDKFTPGSYVYDIIAYDPESGRRTVAFFGTITHEYGATYIP